MLSYFYAVFFSGGSLFASTDTFFLPLLPLFATPLPFSLLVYPRVAVPPHTSPAAIWEVWRSCSLRTAGNSGNNPKKLT